MKTNQQIIDDINRFNKNRSKNYFRARNKTRITDWLFAIAALIASFSGLIYYITSK